MGIFSKLTRPKPKEFIIKSIPLILEMTEAPLDMQFMAIGAPFDEDRRIRAKIYARAISSGTIIAAYETACEEADGTITARSSRDKNLFYREISKTILNPSTENNSLIQQDKASYERWVASVHEDVELITKKHLRHFKPRHEEWSDEIFKLYSEMLVGLSTSKSEEEAENIATLIMAWSKNVADGHVEIYQSILKESRELIQVHKTLL